MFKTITKYFNKIGLAGVVSLMSLGAIWSAIVSLMSNRLKLALILCILAFLLDTLDGYVARKLNKASDFGRQLDGMIDAFNYSLFAALLTWHIILPNVLGAIVGYIILATGIIRLVGFNIEGYIRKDNILYYRGVVTCYISLLAASFVVLGRFIKINDYILAVILTVAAILQLSDIKTRKTNVLIFWIPATIIIGIGILLWL